MFLEPALLESSYVPPTTRAKPYLRAAQVFARSSSQRLITGLRCLSFLEPADTFLLRHRYGLLYPDLVEVSMTLVFLMREATDADHGTARLTKNAVKAHA